MVLETVFRRYRRSLLNPRLPSGSLPGCSRPGLLNARESRPMPDGKHVGSMVTGGSGSRCRGLLRHAEQGTPWRAVQQSRAQPPGRGVFLHHGRAALPRRPNFLLRRPLRVHRKITAAGHRSPTGSWLPAHASTPLHNSAVESPRALARRATFLMPGFLSPRSMPLM